MRGRFADRMHWTALAVLLVIEETFGLIVYALRSTWFVVTEKIALEWRQFRQR